MALPMGHEWEKIQYLGSHKDLESFLCQGSSNSKFRIGCMANISIEFELRENTYVKKSLMPRIIKEKSYVDNNNFNLNWWLQPPPKKEL